MRAYEDLRRRYAEADFLQPQHIEASQRFLKDWSRADIQKFTSDNMVTYRLGQASFQLLVHTPLDPSGQIIAVPTGYGTGFGAPAVARAMAIREVVDPHATLVVQANISPVYSTNNFSPAEERLLEQGDFTPMRDRLNVALEDVAHKFPDAKVAYAGGSLGAAVVGSVLAHVQEMTLGASGGTIVDPANIARRGLTRLGSDFTRDVDEMSRVGAANFSSDWWVRGLLEDKRVFNGDRLQLAAGKTALREAFYLAQALGHERLREDLLAVPKDIGLVHMWSKESHISPDIPNQQIAEDMVTSEHPAYRPIRISDPRSRHGVTVSFGLQGAALEYAMELSKQEQSDIQ